MKCIYCGTENKSNKKCIHCGNNVNGEADVVYRPKSPPINLGNEKKTNDEFHTSNVHIKPKVKLWSILKTYSIIITSILILFFIYQLNTCISGIEEANEWIDELRTDVEVIKIDIEHIKKSLAILEDNENAHEDIYTINLINDRYIIKFNINCDDNVNIFPQDIILEMNDELQSKNILTPHRDGFNFVEWNTEDDGTGIALKENSSYAFHTDTMLYAIWEEEKFEENSYSNEASEEEQSLTDETIED